MYIHIYIYIYIYCGDLLGGWRNTAGNLIEISWTPGLDALGSAAEEINK